MPRLPFATRSARNRSLPVSVQRLINLMAQPQQEDAKARLPVYPTPGLRQFGEVPENRCRGLHQMGTALFAVIGVGVYRFAINGVGVLLGTIPAGGPVSLDSNGELLCIVLPDTGQGFVVDRSSGVITPITDTDFLGATSVCVIGGYYVFSRQNSGEFFLSAINDPLTFDALDFATAEGQPDNLVTVLRAGDSLWLFGERTVEVWSNTGATDFPFLKISGGFVSRGTPARFSVTERLGGPVWLGNDRAVYTAQGVLPQKISSAEMDQAVGGYERIDDAEAWVYEQDGHAYYVLTFPDAGDTWVINLTAQATAHERESEGVEIWRPTRGVPFAGGIVAGDFFNGKLWLIDPAYGLEGDAQIIRVATGTVFHSEGRRVFIDRVVVEFEAGAGLNAGQGSEPLVGLSWSDDGGFTFGNEIQVSIGRIGEYRKRAEWRRCGAARARVFRLRWSDPIYTTVIAINIDAEPGDD